MPAATRGVRFSSCLNLIFLYGTATCLCLPGPQYKSACPSKRQTQRKGACSSHCSLFHMCFLRSSSLEDHFLHSKVGR